MKRKTTDLKNYSFLNKNSFKVVNDSVVTSKTEEVGGSNQEKTNSKFFSFFWKYSFQRKTAVDPENVINIIPENATFSYPFLKVSVCCPEEGFSLTCEREKARGGGTGGYRGGLSCLMGGLFV